MAVSYYHFDVPLRLLMMSFNEVYYNFIHA